MAKCKYTDERKVSKTLVSPSTGRTMREYISDSMALIGKTSRQMERDYGFCHVPIGTWVRGESNPSLAVLLRWEKATGLPLNDYIPEIHKGVDLMVRAKEWERGFMYCTRQCSGCHISRGKRAECLAGTITTNGMWPSTPMAFVAAKKVWDESHAGDEKTEYVPKQKTFLKAREDDSFDVDVVQVYGDEGARAARMCRWATGQNSTKAYGLSRLKEGLWVCELETSYRIEIDTVGKMIRWIWKKTGALSFERCYHGA